MSRPSSLSAPERRVDLKKGLGLAVPSDWTSMIFLDSGSSASASATILAPSGSGLRRAWRRGVAAAKGRQGDGEAQSQPGVSSASSLHHLDRAGPPLRRAVRLGDGSRGEPDGVPDGFRANARRGGIMAEAPAPVEAYPSAFLPRIRPLNPEEVDLVSLGRDDLKAAIIEPLNFAQSPLLPKSSKGISTRRT